MLPFWFPIALAQTVPVVNLPPKKVVPPPELLPLQDSLPLPESLPSQEVVQFQDVRPLPGELDTVPVFNSNSPELILNEGILLSTFPPDDKAVPEAHLDFPFEGRFDLFSHHITRARTTQETRSLFQGILIYNPGSEPVRLDILQAATYLTRPDALFVDLPDYVENPLGTVYSGPGSRTMNDILRGRRQGNWPDVITLEPGESQMLMNLPLPAGLVAPTSNGRTTLMRLWSSGKVYVATMAMFSPKNPDGTERIPTLEEWQTFLATKGLAGPRDRSPTPLVLAKSGNTPMIYGRVAGVAQGSQWQARLTDSPKTELLTIPKVNHSFSYGLSTLPKGRLGTGQVQSAPMLARYHDTAYLAHGNYGIHYNLTLPLYNPTSRAQTVALSLQTPLKEDQARGGLLFLWPPEQRIFFRGTVRVRFNDDSGNAQTRFIHLVQRRGQQGEPLAQLKMPPGDRRLVQVDLLYPPDATPPQVLTVQTLGNP